MINSIRINVPTLLTLCRLILSPVVMPALLIWFLPLNMLEVNCFLALIFILFSLTDFFDGYLARHYQQETSLGRLLDPIADKFLVYSTLIALVATHKLYFFWTIIIVGREFFVTGMREIALFYGFSVPVSTLGKLKTLAQMVFLTFVIINPAQQDGIKRLAWNGTEGILLACTLSLTIASAFLYFRQFNHAWKLKNQKNNA